MDAFVGGPRGIRTLDLLNAIEARSQLRYGPKNKMFRVPRALCVQVFGALEWTWRELNPRPPQCD